MLFAFVVLGLVCSVLSQTICWDARLRNDLFVESEMSTETISPCVVFSGVTETLFGGLIKICGKQIVMQEVRGVLGNSEKNEC